MALLQPKLSLKVAQRQILTPGLMQMVSVLALNKLELKEMINAEITENPILEEIDESVPLLDEVAGQEIEHDRAIELRTAEAAYQDDRDIRATLLDFPRKLGASHIGHRLVGNQEIEAVRCGPKRCQCRDTGIEADRLVP